MNESFTGLDNDINDYLVYSTNAFLDAHGRGLEEPDDMQQVLDALLELHDLEPSVESQVYESNYLTIVNAIHLNEVFQSVVNKQIEAIDQLLETNQQLMKEASHSAIKENRFGHRFLIHKVYEDDINYFDSSELLLEDNQDVPEEEEQGVLEEEVEEEPVAVDSSGDASVPCKAWHLHERERLLEGIRSEAKRMISFDHMKRNEAWRIWEVDKIENKQLELFPVSRIDWTRISHLHVRTRSPTECLIQWTTQEHPLINKKPWTKEESMRLSELVDKFGLFSGQWETIANELNTNRTISQCFSHYMAAKNNANARSLKWSPEEDRQLRDAVKVFGSFNWQQVASILKGRTGQQCLHRWSKSLNPAIKRTRWTEEEDRLLARAVSLYGLGNWTKIQRLIPQRTDMQCRERWVNNCHPTLKGNPATEEEKARIVELVKEHGTKWSVIARSLPGRTDNFVMRTYKGWLRKQADPATLKKRGRKPKPDAAKTRVTKPRTTKSKVAKLKATKSKTTKPKATKPKATKPKADKPKADKPKADKPKADKPKTTKPKADKPKTTKQ
ncbi:hypothetical protein BD560DRAFT_370414 [Blakeslea trispora]|nr:hypothetical protein BD560DRAFT_370414 [Blakeslea trispora]